jgi:hypothetical protein
MGPAGEGVSYEKPNPSESCTGNNPGVRSAHGAGDIRYDTATTSPVGRSSWKIPRLQIRLDRWVLAVGRQAQHGKKRGVRVGAWQVETVAPSRCGMGFANLALRPWRLDFRWGPLALTPGGQDQLPLTCQRWIRIAGTTPPDGSIAYLTRERSGTTRTV